MVDSASKLFLRPTIVDAISIWPVSGWLLTNCWSYKWFWFQCESKVSTIQLFRFIQGDKNFHLLEETFGLIFFKWWPMAGKWRQIFVQLIVVACGSSFMFVHFLVGIRLPNDLIDHPCPLAISLTRFCCVFPRWSKTIKQNSSFHHMNKNKRSDASTISHFVTLFDASYVSHHRICSCGIKINIVSIHVRYHCWKKVIGPFTCDDGRKWGHEFVPYFEKAEATWRLLRKQFCEYCTRYGFSQRSIGLLNRKIIGWAGPTPTGIDGRAVLPPTVFGRKGFITIYINVDIVI